MASLKELSPNQLTALAAIRARRREVASEAAAENRELLNIVNAAANRRSDKRHRFMLLSGAIVGVTAPLLVQNQAVLPVDPWFVRTGSALLLVNIIVGAVFDALDEMRTTPVLLRASIGVRTAAALTLAEDIKLFSAQAGDTSPDLEQVEKQARDAAAAAHREVQNAGEWFANVSALEKVLFFGTFVAGVAFLLLAVGTAAEKVPQ